MEGFAVGGQHAAAVPAAVPAAAAQTGAAEDPLLGRGRHHVRAELPQQAEEAGALRQEGEGRRGHGLVQGNGMGTGIEEVGCIDHKEMD